MHPVEFEAYRMLIQHGTIDQAAESLQAIVKVEDSVPEELIPVIIQAMRQRGSQATGSRMFVHNVHALIGKTKSKDLYRAAQEMDYLSDYRFANNPHLYTCEKIVLFTDMLYYDEQLEDLALQELLKWMTYFDRMTLATYSDESTASLVHDCDPMVRSAIYRELPAMLVDRLLSAIEQIGSDRAHRSLAALEYIFRPHLNDYVMLQQRLAQEGDPRGVPFDPDDGSNFFDLQNTYIMRGILDRMQSTGQTASRASGQPTSRATNQSHV